LLLVSVEGLGQDRPRRCWASRHPPCGSGSPEPAAG
jgi:hypothetical protein